MTQKYSPGFFHWRYANEVTLNDKDKIDAYIITTKR